VALLEAMDMMAEVNTPARPRAQRPAPAGPTRSSREGWAWSPGRRDHRWVRVERVDQGRRTRFFVRAAASSRAVAAPSDRRPARSGSRRSPAEDIARGPWRSPGPVL